MPETRRRKPVIPHLFPEFRGQRGLRGGQDAEHKGVKQIRRLSDSEHDLRVFREDRTAIVGDMGHDFEGVVVNRAALQVTMKGLRCGPTCDQETECQHANAGGAELRLACLRCFSEGNDQQNDCGYVQV